MKHHKVYEKSAIYWITTQKNEIFKFFKINLAHLIYFQEKLQEIYR